ncbi:cytochrome P450 [Poronia punctata]|nr:cytochrome P450 [Poronia punctata]
MIEINSTPTLVLLFITFIWVWLTVVKSSSDLPSAGRHGISIFNRLESITQGKNVLHGIYNKQLKDTKLYKLHGVFGDAVVLPPSLLQWLISQPEAHLSAKWAQLDALNIPATFLRPEIGVDPVHEPLIRRNLTAHLDDIAGDVWEEVGLALELAWGNDTNSWRRVNLDHTVRRVVARAANRVFVGDDLCRDDDYIESSIHYVTQVSTCGLLMNTLPSWLKGIIGFAFTIPIRVAYSQCSKHLQPMFLRLVDNKTTAPPHLFSSWLVSNSDKYPQSSPERSPDFLSRRILALNFAAIHTSTLTTCNLLLDIFSQNSTQSLLRDEIQTNSSQWNKTCNRARLNQMPRLDSALRESLRLWGLVAKAMSRKVVHPAGITLPTGQHLRQGVTVCISGWGLHHDKSLYTRPFDFVHDRFMRAAPNEENQMIRGKAASSGQVAAAETDERFAAWGIGKHACPGRFFAVDLIKIILARILLEYEVQIQEQRPENMWIEYNVIPPPNATLCIRRRRAAL